MDIESGVEVPIGKSGEILIKGPTVMKEYWKKVTVSPSVLLSCMDALPVCPRVARPPLVLTSLLQISPELDRKF